MKRTFINYLMLFVAITFTSCSAIYENGEELAASIQNNIAEISADELRTRIENGEDFLLIDVRQSNDYKNGAIPGALNIPRGALEIRIRDDEFWEEEFLYTPENDAEIILYCKLGYRGALSAFALQQLGFTNVKNLHGGILNWDPNIDNNTPKTAGGGGCGE
ncbi:MAG: hypothetical protein IH597_05305 [Bacteroidales bacterium]|nr:hypothetical protein [Bacteroidales bacterium]